MIIRRLDASGDWTFGKGMSNYCKNNEAIIQNMTTRILSWMYNCFFAMNDGIDYHSLMEINQSLNLIKSIKITTLASYGVIAVNSINVSTNRNTRNGIITYNVDTIFSQDISGII